MTAQKERSSSAPVLARVTLLATLGLAACNTVAESPQGPTDTPDGTGNDDTNNPPVGDGDVTPPGDGDGGDGDVTPPGGDGDQEPCALALKSAEEALNTYCTQCHGEVPVNNGFANITNAQNLVATGRVIPDDPDNSPMFQRLSSNTMPPSSVEKRPAQSDIDAIRTWISCGAEPFTPENKPLPFVSIDERLELMADDLRSISNPGDREDVRYIDLYTLSNAGFSEKQLDEYRDAVSFLINSLSQGQRVVAPQAVDDKKLLFRIELSDYDWNADTWNTLTEAYPYAVQYDEDSELFPFNESNAEEIREDTQEDVPYIDGDWFLANATSPALYLELLGLPGNGAPLSELENLLGINILENIAAEQVDRAGFLNSDPSDANRLLERHELPGNQGGFWISYDFADNDPDQGNSLFADPLTFTADGGEALFHLPNGLLAYYVIAGDVLAGEGRELNIAPINVVQDPQAFDGQVATGRSCMTCHKDGEIAKNDQIRDHVLENGTADLDAVLALYPTRDEMSDLYEEDQNRYRSAMAALNITKINERTMHSTHLRHLDELDADDVAAILGITTEDFIRALDSGIGQVPDEFLVLRTEGGIIDRDAVDLGIGELVEAIGLGQSINPSN